MVLTKLSLLLLIIPLFFSCSQAHMHQEAPFDGKKVTIETGGLKDDIPVFYTLRENGKHINFFIIKQGEEVLSFLDACLKCYPQKRGFRFEGGRLVCNVCNVGYPASILSEGVGTCHPLPLKGRLKDDIYEIEKTEIMKAAKYF